MYRNIMEFDGKVCEVCGSQANNMQVTPNIERYWCDDHVPDDFGWWKT